MTIKKQLKQLTEITLKTWTPLTNIVWLFELLFVFIMPIHLWGWKIGLLIVSGLTSLLHIVLLLQILIVSILRTGNEKGT